VPQWPGMRKLVVATNSNLQLTYDLIPYPCPPKRLVDHLVDAAEGHSLNVPVWDAVSGKVPGSACQEHGAGRRFSLGRISEYASREWSSTTECT